MMSTVKVVSSEGQGGRVGQYGSIRSPTPQNHAHTPSSILLDGKVLYEVCTQPLSIRRGPLPKFPRRKNKFIEALPRPISNEQGQYPRRAPFDSSEHYIVASDGFHT
jgi:hypothetical protein